MDIFSTKIFWSVLGVTTFVGYYLYKSKKPRLIFEKTSLNESILKNMKKIHQNFYSTFWMINPHAQTILSEMIRNLQGDKIDYER